LASVARIEGQRRQAVGGHAVVGGFGSGDAKAVFGAAVFGADRQAGAVGVVDDGGGDPGVGGVDLVAHLGECVVFGAERHGDGTCARLGVEAADRRRAGVGTELDGQRAGAEDGRVGVVEAAAGDGLHRSELLHLHCVSADRGACGGGDGNGRVGAGAGGAAPQRCRTECAGLVAHCRDHALHLAELRQLGRELRFLAFESHQRLALDGQQLRDDAVDVEPAADAGGGDGGHVGFFRCSTSVSAARC
jgi:hypothetical protein